jgi:hypothetical protein
VSSADAVEPLQLTPPKVKRNKKPAARERRPWRAPRRWSPKYMGQLELAGQERLGLDLTEDEAWDEQGPAQRVVVAAWLPPPVTRAARSVFDLAAGMGECADAVPDASPYPAEVRQVVRTGGTTRHVGCAYPSNRWTPEREEQERARRARQRPPKPVKGARTRSRKLREMIGEEA